MSKHAYIAGGFILGALVFIGAGVYGYSEWFPRASQGSIAKETVEEFTTEMRGEVVASIGQPIEGFEPSMFLQVFPGLQRRDFNNVDALIGGYRYDFAKDEIVYDLQGEQELHSAARAISDEGMMQLLSNLSTRLSINLEGGGTVADIMQKLRAQSLDAAPAEGEVAIRGHIVCLPHKGDGEFHTLECAFGLQDEAGRYYALRDTDPRYGNVSTAPMNVRVEVTGTLKLKESDRYQSIGIIEVKKIEIADTPKRMSVGGTYLCLPHRDTSGPQTKECAFGVRTDAGKYYALDLELMSEIVPALSSGEYIQVEGVFTPLEQLSTNWQKYPIEGVLSAMTLKIAK